MSGEELIQQEKVDQWFQLHANNQNKEANTFYWREIWPWVSQKFVKQCSQYVNKFETLISLVGMSPEPIILTILALKPAEVKFIISPETKKMLDIIVEKANLKPSQYETEKVDSSNIEEVYLSIRKFIGKSDTSKIAVDISGGKKSMVGGAAQAAGYFGCTVFYVDYHEYHKDLRKPIPGTEYLSLLRNPYEIFGELEMDRAQELYRAGDFSAAVEVVSRLLIKAPEIKEARIKKEIFAMYNAWDAYLFEKAQHHATAALGWIEKYKRFNELKETLIEQKEILQKILEQESPWIVLNHYTKAMQYGSRQKYDFAILLLYRTLELLLSLRLKEKYDINASAPDYSAFPDLLEKFNQKVKEIYGRAAKLQNSLPLKIGLMAGITLLSIFDDPIVQNVDLKHVREQADNRNQGILAHGLKPNTKKQFDSMNREFKPIIKRFLKSYFPDESFESLLEKFKPVNLN